jgi:GH25 family lysozyme M1 (1,4-beta-N-acetylmuramidase)
MSDAPANGPSPPASESGPPTTSRSERFRNVMLGLAGAITAVVIPVLGIYYTSSDKEREVSKDFVEISTKILSDKPSDDNRPLREWAIAVLDKYSPVPLSVSTKALLLNSQPIYSNPATIAGAISQKSLQNLEEGGLTLGIFLSHFNSAPDFAALKAHQIEFAYIKLSQGTSFIDAKAGEYVMQARAAGLKVGVYHFFIADDDADAQFAHFQSALQGVQWDLPPMMDCEEQAGHKAPADYAARVASFAEKVVETYHVKPLIYAGSAFANASLDQSVAKYPLFIANFGAATRGNPTLPKWWTSYLFWHVAPGVADDPVLRTYDIIAFKGSAAGLASLAPSRN